MGGSNHDPTLHPHCQNHCRHRNRNRRGHRNPHRDQGGLEHGLEGGYAEPYHGAGKAPSPQPPSRALQRWQPRLLPSRESTKIPETGPGEEHEEHEEREECEEWALPAVSGACGRALTALQKALLTRLRILRWAPRLSEGIGIGIGMELAAETRVVAAEMRVKYTKEKDKAKAAGREPAQPEVRPGWREGGRETHVDCVKCGKSLGRPDFYPQLLHEQTCEGPKKRTG